MILNSHHVPEPRPSCRHVNFDESPVRSIFLDNRTFPLSAIVRFYRQCQMPWLGQLSLCRGSHTAVGISPAVGGQ